MTLLNLYFQRETPKNAGTRWVYYIRKQITNSIKKDFEDLNNFIKILNPLQYNRLRSTIRVQRKRKKTTLKPVQMSISYNTHVNLKLYATSYNVTLSEAIAKLLKESQFVTI